MILDDNVAFSTNWDIDKLVYSGESTVTIPGTTYPAYSVVTVAAIPVEYSSTGTPFVDAVFRVGSGNWQQFGDLSGYFLLNSSSSIWIRGTRWGVAAETITVRYYIYGDKVNY